MEEPEPPSEPVSPKASEPVSPKAAEPISPKVDPFDPFGLGSSFEENLPPLEPIGRHAFARILLHSADTDEHLEDVFIRHEDSVLALRQAVGIALSTPYVSISFEGAPLVDCLTLEEAGLVHESKVSVVIVQSVTLATSCMDNSIKLWDLETGVCHETLWGHADHVFTVAFSPSGSTIVTASADRTAKLWAFSNGECLAKLEGHSDWVNSAQFSPDELWVVTSSMDCTAMIWDAGTGDCIRTLPQGVNPIFCASFSPCGQYIITSSADRTASIWDASTGEKTRTLAGHSDIVLAVAFSATGKEIVTGSADCTAKIWHGKTVVVAAAARLSLDGIIHSVPPSPCNLVLKEHKDHVTGVVFSPDGKQVATSSMDRTAIIWDATTGERLRTLTGHKGVVTSVAFSPDGHFIITGSRDCTVKVWDAKVGKCLGTLEGHGAKVTSACFMPY